MRAIDSTKEIMSLMTLDAALAKGTALLALKMAGLHYMTIRERLLTGDQVTGRAALWKEDTEWAKPLQFALKTFFMATGPSFASVARYTGCIGNSNENEPYFIAMALAAAKSGLVLPAWAPTVVSTFVAARYIHAFIYIFLNDKLPQPGRAAPWSVGLFCMIAFAVAVLKAG